MLMNSDKLCGNVMNSVQRIGCILMVNSACVCHQCEKLILYIRLYIVKNLYMCSESRETISLRINSTPMDRVVMVLNQNNFIQFQCRKTNIQAGAGHTA